MFLSNGRGLGRSLSYVGRNQISLPMMLHRSVVHKLPFAAASEASAWNRRAKVAFQSYPAGLACHCRTNVALRSYFSSFSMELSFKSCFTSFCMQLSCKSRLAKLFLKLLRRTVVQKLPGEVVSQPLAWSCRAKAAFRNYLASFCIASSCKGCLAKLFLELLHGTVV